MTELNMLIRTGIGKDISERCQTRVYAYSNGEEIKLSAKSNRPEGYWLYAIYDSGKPILFYSVESLKNPPFAM